MNKKIITLPILFLLFAAKLPAQITEAERKYTAFDMRSNGKIYIVVAVIVIIVVGLFLYLISLEKRIKKMEKEAK
jgi:divalent metal cation (Fe/Co/Zn/Cd) transporter